MTGWRKIVANLLQAPLNMILFTISIYICNNKCRHMINIQHCQYRCNGVESIRLPSSSLSPPLTSDRLRLPAPRSLGDEEWRWSYFYLVGRMNYRRNLFQDDLCVSFLEEIFIFYADNLYINTHSTSHYYISLLKVGRHWTVRAVAVVTINVITVLGVKGV